MGKKQIKSSPTWQATIWLGLQEGYDGPIHSIEELKDKIAVWADSNKICVTVTPTEFIYVYGREPGAAIGFIQYPRFPKPVELLEEDVLNLARILIIIFNQYRCSITFPDQTVMLENEDLTH